MSRKRKERRGRKRRFTNEQFPGEVVDMGPQPNGIGMRISIRFDDESGPMLKSFAALAQFFTRGEQAND